MKNRRDKPEGEGGDENVDTVGNRKNILQILKCNNVYLEPQDAPRDRNLVLNKPSCGI